MDKNSIEKPVNVQIFMTPGQRQQLKERARTFGFSGHMDYVREAIWNYRPGTAPAEAKAGLDVVDLAALIRDAVPREKYTSERAPELNDPGHKGNALTEPMAKLVGQLVADSAIGKQVLGSKEKPGLWDYMRFLYMHLKVDMNEAKKVIQATDYDE